MRLNGTQKIITLDDILVNNEDLSLLGVLDEHTSDIDKLKSNVKWLYKYGGTGSGIGGGQQQKEFSINALLDNKQISDGVEINFAHTGNYLLYVKVKNPDPDVRSYYMQYSYNIDNTDKKLDSNKIELNGENSYSTTVPINLVTNGELLITVTDPINEITKSVFCKYVTLPYTVRAILTNDDNQSYAGLTTVSDYEIDSTTALLSGLNVKIDYTVKINSKYQASYDIIAPDEHDSLRDINIDSISSDNNNTTAVIKIPKTLLTNEKSGIYVINIKFKINAIDEPIVTTLKYNLIPKDIYLMVQPQTGIIYKQRQQEDSAYKYNRGNIVFNIKAYQGSNTNKLFNVKVLYDDLLIEDKIIDERVSNSAIIKVDSGEHVVKFILTNVANSNYTTTSSYYLYVKENSLSKLDWYNVPEEEKSKIITDRYDLGIGCVSSGGEHNNINLIFKDYTNSPLKKSINSKDDVLLLDNSNSINNDQYHTHLSIGIQYSKINTYNDDIIICERYGSDGQIFLTLRLTQNKIFLFGDSKGIDYFLNLELDVDSSNGDKYHIIDIYSILKESGANQYYEMSIYIDGVLEAAPVGYVKNAFLSSKITFKPGNYYINHFEHSIINTTKIEHIDVLSYRYYLNYLNKVLSVDEEIQNDFDSLVRFNNFWLAGIVDSYNNKKDIDSDSIETQGLVRIKTQEDIENIAVLSNIPSLKFTMKETLDGENIWSYLRNANTSVKRINVGLSYCPVDSLTKVGTGFVQIETPDNTTFEIEQQGSSSQAYGTKNYELYLTDNAGSDLANTRVVLFSPNFKKADPTTFLPERSFTLKADMVDSSHSNNTSIGAFVNDVEVPVKTQIGDTMPYFSHLKNCLTGYPIAVYYEVQGEDENGIVKSKYYYGGIYNLNLGRKSANNLGYTDRSNMEDKIQESWQDGNTFSFITLVDNKLKDNFISCEVLDKNRFWDFSQYNPSVLFTLDGLTDDTDTQHMLGDITTSYDEKLMQTITSNAISSLSKAGGYLFETLLQKNLSNSANDEYGYKTQYHAVNENNISINRVPNYRYLFIRKQFGSLYKYTAQEPIDSATKQDLIDAVVGDVSNSISPKWNYLSIVEYYTICMAFLLSDSVEKNVQLKTWNGKTWFVEFYDMDTCLGKDNKGEDTEYFAFSDYWKPYTSSDNSVVDMNVSQVYRDFYPEIKAGNNVPNGYDIPSSYLFAIAKYTVSAFDDDSTITTYPQLLWAKWRSPNKNANDKSQGILVNADNFIDNYWGKAVRVNLKPLINFNYRTKYLHTNLKMRDPDADVHNYDIIDFVKFHGTGLAKLRYWLLKRFLLLDAYFNISGQNRVFLKYNTQDNTYSYIVLNNTSLNEKHIKGNFMNVLSNPDIIVLQSIFAPTGVYSLFSSSFFEATVKAPDYTPLNIYSGVNNILYVYGGDKGQFHFKVDVSGAQNNIIGGSNSWTYLNSIDGFLMHLFYLKSDKLLYISGELAAISNFELFFVPSAKVIKFNSKKMQGLLTIDGLKYLSLDTLDLHNSNISLNISNCNLQKIDISGIGADTTNGVNITIDKCDDLKNLILSNSSSLVQNPTKINNLNITKISPSVLDISEYNLDVRYISIDTTESENHKLSLVDCRNLEKLTITGEGYSEIRLENCSNLKQIVIPSNSLKKLSISGCGSLTTIGDTNGIIDLSKLNADLNVIIRSCGKITNIKFGDRVTLGDRALSNNASLKYIDGKELNIVGPAVFEQCANFTGTSNGTKVCNFKFNTNNLNSMFSINNDNSEVKGAIVLSIANLILNKDRFVDPSSVTSMNYFFANLNITYTVNDLIADYNNPNSAKLNMSIFTNLVSVDYMYKFNNVTAVSRQMCSFGTNVLHNINTYVVNQKSVLYILTDCLEDSCEKLTSLVILNLDLTGVSFLIGDVYSDERGNKLQHIDKNIFNTQNLKVERLFNPWKNGLKLHPTNLLTLNNFVIYNVENLYPRTYDLSNIFTEEWKITRLYNFLYGSGYFSYSIKITSNEKSTAEGLLRPISKTLTNIEHCFNFVTLNGELIDLYNFIDWEKINKNLISIYQQYTFYKQCSYDNYIKIVDLCTNNNKLESFNSLFEYTYIYGELNPKVYLGNKQNNKIVSTHGMFANCKFVTDIDTKTVVYVSLEDHPFKYLPNIKNVQRMFSNSAVLSLNIRDLFNKRVSIDLIDNNYFYKETVSQIVEGITTYKDVYKKAIAKSYSYKKDILYCYEMFSGCSFKIKSVSLENVDEHVTFYKADHLDQLLTKDQIYIFKENQYVKYTGSIYLPENSEPNKDLIVPPDILYACASGADCNSMFVNSSLVGELPNELFHYYDGLSINRLFNSCTLFPKDTGLTYTYSIHLFDGSLQQVTLKIFQVVPDYNLSLIHVSRENTTFYIGFPDNFVISKFRLYIFSDKSVNPNTIYEKLYNEGSFSIHASFARNSLPALIIDPLDTVSYNTLNINVGIMYKKNDDGSYNPQEDGIDVNKFTSTMFGTLVQNNFALYCNTQVFTRNTDLKYFNKFVNSYMVNNLKVYSKIIYGPVNTGSNKPLISNFIKLPKATSSFDTSIMPDRYVVYKHQVETGLEKYKNFDNTTTVNQLTNYYQNP